MANKIKKRKVTGLLMSKEFKIDKDDGTCLECNILLADICGVCHRKLIEQKEKELIEEFEKMIILHKEKYNKKGYGYEVLHELERAFNLFKSKKQ